jgi:HK97 family phage major capsid protein
MSTIKELREQQARIATNARAKFNEITAATDEARAAEVEREFDAMMADHDKIGAKIERLQKLEEAETRANSGDDRRPRGEDKQTRGADDGLKLEYREVFGKFVCGHDLSAEERSILQRGQAETRAQTAGTTTAGGFTVPTELLSQIEISMKAHGPMYDGAVTSEIRTASGNPLKMPTVDDTAKVAVAHTEAGAVTDDGGEDVTFGQKSLDAYSFDTEWIRWSWELDMDSIFSMEALLGALLGERLGRTANAQLTTGTGSSAPNGIVTASTLGKTSASATAITADEVIDLLHAVDPAYRMSPKAGFMFNDSTLAALRKLKDGDGNYLWQMGDVTKGVPGTLLGYRYYVNQAMASIPGSASASKVMLFGDLGKYYVRKVGSPITFVARERFAPDLGILGLIRFDGELANTAAVKHLITAAA